MHTKPHDAPDRPLPLDAVIPWLERGPVGARVSRAAWLLQHRPDLRAVPRVRRWVRGALRHEAAGEAAEAVRALLAATGAHGRRGAVKIVPCGVPWSSMSSDGHAQTARTCASCQQTVTKVHGLAEAAAFVGKGCVLVEPAAGETAADIYTVALSGGDDLDDPRVPRRPGKIMPPAGNDVPPVPLPPGKPVPPPPPTDEPILPPPTAGMPMYEDTGPPIKLPKRWPWSSDDED